MLTFGLLLCSLDLILLSLIWFYFIMRAQISKVLSVLTKLHLENKIYLCVEEQYVSTWGRSLSSSQQKDGAPDNDLYVAETCRSIRHINSLL